MSSKRKYSPYGIYHVIMKGNNQQVIFEEDFDYSQFLATIKYYKEKYVFEVLAYCLMDNHVHLLISGDLEMISDVMRSVQVKFVRWYNLKYQRKGHLFQNRFWSEPVDSPRYMRALHRYIHQNPCRAGLCGLPVEYRWSSAREYEAGRSSITDLEMMQSLFSTDEALVRHMNNFSSDLLRYYYSDKRVPDNVAIEMIRELTHFQTVSEIQKLNLEYRNEILIRILKKIKLSDKQLSRLTGVSIKVIAQLKKSIEANDLLHTR